MASTTTAAATVAFRRVAKIVTATRQKEGAGFVVAQPVPHRQLSELDTDPFLMVHCLGPIMADHRTPGAPWHPHRGFDTISYIRHGESQHQDSMGNKGVIKSGEVQWMRAGSGVIHDEGQKMSPSDPARVMEGFQIWVNLPASLKMSPPDYRHLTAETFVWRDYDDFGTTGTRAKLFAGSFQRSDSSGAAPAFTSPLGNALSVPVLMADVEMQPDSRAVFSLEDSLETVIVFVYHGALRVFKDASDTVGTVVKRDGCAVYEAGQGAIRVETLPLAQYPAAQPKADAVKPLTSDALETQAQNFAGATFLILGGKKIREPVARYGPFVMNTEDELQRAFEDYRSGKLATVRGSETRY